MKQIKINPDGGKILVSLVFDGVFSAGYHLKLGERNSNTAVMYEDGDNYNTEDDKYFLPTPTADNLNRILRLITTFKGEDVDQYPGYTIKIEVYQDGQLLDYEVESGKLDKTTQESMMFIKFV